MIDPGVVTYIHDILVYRQTMVEHGRLIKAVLSCFQKWDFRVSIDKCEFYKSEIEFLSYILSDMGINIVQDKV
jgi:hypothetical protein